MIDRQSLTICHRSYGTPQTERLLDDLFKWQFDKSAVTVVGTGNTPLKQSQSPFTSRLLLRCATVAMNDSSLNTTFDSTLSPIASTDYGIAIGWNGIGNISEVQRNAILSLVQMAHSRGILSRFWDTPGWPIHARDAVWQELLNDGSDWLNADDLKAASAF